MVDQLAAALPDAEASRLIGSPFGISDREADAIARQVVEDYRRRLMDRRLRDLTAEKYLCIIDGEGDGQWADIYHGSRVVVMPSFGALRLQWNVTRPIVMNAIAHNTAIPYRVVAESASGRRARQRAIADTILGNYVIRALDLNGVYARALSLACPYGSCPVHFYWRADASALSSGSPAEADLPGFVCAFAGDPWATVYGEGSTADAITEVTYERLLPANLLRRAFGRDDLEGYDGVPSVSRAQRVHRLWHAVGGSPHGTAAILGYHRGKGEEIIPLLCREVERGMDPDWPEGRLTLVAVCGVAEVSPGAEKAGVGRPVLLYDGPLPAGRIALALVTSHERWDDVLGKPWVADLADLQVQLNQLVTLRAEFLRRIARPPLATTVDLQVDQLWTNDDAVLKVTPGSPLPEIRYPPPSMATPYDRAIEQTMDQMFRIGGWQAASRGEASPGQPAAALVALAKADDTIFGPLTRSTEAALRCGLKIAHTLVRRYMLEPLVIDRVLGDEYGYLSEYLHRDQLSDTPPNYTLVSGFGATIEQRAQQIIAMAQTTGADGVPFITTAQARRLWPDPSLIPDTDEAQRARENRATVINEAIIALAENTMSSEEAARLDPALREVIAQQLYGQMIYPRYPILRTDDPQYHVERLDELVQDEHEHPLARAVAAARQNHLFEWMSQIARAQAGAVEEDGPVLEAELEEEPALPAGGGGGETALPVEQGGMMERQVQPGSLMSEVRALTNQAYGGV